ncbi:hypothetical protein MKX01_028068 [Papaver californicum]|nr:hypothetical protein MKX01_028068 [Papaver californicum]
MSSLRSTTMQQGIELSAVFLLLFFTLPADVLAFSSRYILTRSGSLPITISVHAKHYKKKFAPRPWKHAQTTFYEGSATTYESAALSTALFNDGYGCGSCYQIKYFCPPNYALPSNNRGCRNPPNYHFNLPKTAFLEIAEYKAGIVPVQYRRNSYYNKIGSVLDWITDAKCVGESLTFRVIASDGRSSTSWHVTPANWQFGQTFEGKNFK